MSDYYLPDAEGNPVPTDMMTWARWFEDTNARQIARTQTTDGGWVSTVFLGLDHGWGEGLPVLWETLAFDRDGLSIEETQERHTSRADALAGHAACVKERNLNVG